MLTKNLTVTEMDDTGKGLALIADLSKVDNDNDGYAKGAFAWKEQWAQLLTAHNLNMIPFGKARIFEDGDFAFAELHLNLEVQAGREWHSALKFDLANGSPIQEWSYGYTALEFERVFRELRKGRILKKVDVHEVSTVVRGAGTTTGTLSMKNLKAQLKDGEFDAVINHLGEMADTLKGDPGLLSATGRKQLGEIHAALGVALIDPAEAEAKANAAIEHEVTRHLTRDARMRLGV